MNTMKDRVAIVTGAGDGMGKEIALYLAQEGAKVVVNDIGVRDPEAAQKVVDEIKKNGGDAVASTDDVSTMAGGENMVKLAIDNFGKIDAVACVAGIMCQKPIDEHTEAEWDKVVDVSAKGCFAVLHYAVPYMKKQNYGRIICFASRGAFGNGGSVSYSAAKGGVMGLVAELGYELREFGINCNAILPAAVTKLFPAEKGSYDGTPKPWPEGPDMVAPFCTYLLTDKCENTGEFFYVAGTDVAIYPRTRVAMEVLRKGRGEKWTVEELIEDIPGAFGWYFDTRPKTSPRNSKAGK